MTEKDMAVVSDSYLLTQVLVDHAVEIIRANPGMRRDHLKQMVVDSVGLRKVEAYFRPEEPKPIRIDFVDAVHATVDLVNGNPNLDYSDIRDYVLPAIAPFINIKANTYFKAGGDVSAVNAALAENVESYLPTRKLSSNA